MAMSAFAVTKFFIRLRDPRRRHRKLHLLMDIITIALCAVIAGANDWQEVITFAQQRQAWLSSFLALPNGIPSHDTFERVFDRLDPQAFQACFRQWVEALAQTLGLDHIAIDGKTLRHSGNTVKGWRPLHVVSAWASAAHLSMGQVAVEEKSNEITAIPRLLELLDLHGALVTIDAMGCQKEIAKQIVVGGGDYILPVKDNQPNLLDDIQECLAKALDCNFKDYCWDRWDTVESGHGRQEKRSCLILNNPVGIGNVKAWEGLKVIGMCISEREVRGKWSEEVRYFIGSRKMSAQEYGTALRNHWGIENNLHWQLDITFREDANRVQRRHGAENLGLVRRLAVALLKRHPSEASMKCKRLAAAYNTDFLEEILQPGDNLEKR
jgi:predicted transposase YbfD/YdcC